MKFPYTTVVETSSLEISMETLRNFHTYNSGHGNFTSIFTREYLVYKFNFAAFLRKFTETSGNLWRIMGQNYSTKIVGWNSEIGIDLDFPINLRKHDHFMSIKINVAYPFKHNRGLEYNYWFTNYCSIMKDEEITFFTEGNCYQASLRRLFVSNALEISGISRNFFVRPNLE